MSKQVELPSLGEATEACTVLSVLVSEGDRVDEGQGLIEVETDKATAEVPSPSDGVVEEVHVSEGDEVHSGDPIVSFADDVAQSGDEDRERTREPAESEQPEQQEGSDAAKVSDTEGVGEAERDESSDAANTGKSEPADGQRASNAPRTRGTPAPAKRVVAAPSVRRLARELGVDMVEVAESLSSEKISVDDIKAHVRRLLAHGRAAIEDAKLELPDFEQWGEVVREPMKRVRRATAASTRRAWMETPHVTQFDVADTTDIESFREHFGGEVEEAGGRLTLTAIAIKVAAAAIEHFPRFNASIDFAKRELVLKRYVSIGVAVDTDDGLLVPVVREAGKKSLTDISVELGQLAARARSGELRQDELSGASFTVSNLGGLGTSHFTPIVPWPQVAILALGRARPVLALRKGELVERRELPLGVSYDHRCIDGAEAARVLRWIAEVLEEPMRVMMDPVS